MKKFNWTNTIRSNLLLLKLVGLWPEDTRTYRFDLYGIRSALLLFIFVFGHVFFQAVNLVFIYDDLEAVTQIIYLLLMEMVLFVKIYYLVKHMKMVKRLMVMLEDETFQPRNERQVRLVEPSLSDWKSMYRVLSAMTVGANIFWGISPILDTTSGGKRLPFLAWYPYNWRAPRPYVATYVYQVVSCCCISVAHLNIDTLVAALNVYSGNQLDILCDNLRNLKDDTKEKFKDCVLHHRLILRFVEICTHFLQRLLLLQFFVSAFSLGLTMFQLSLVIPFSNQFYSLLSYANAVVVQIFMYCWFGNEVHVKASKVPDAIFESEWIAFPQKVKKDIVFFMLRTQKPVNISAFNLFNLSLESFMKILKTSWSYFALLNQINSRK